MSLRDKVITKRTTVIVNISRFDSKDSVKSVYK